MINNRQNGRRRGRGGQRPQGNPGQPGGGGSRIDNRARGNAAQLHEKYKNLAQDSQRAGDRVTTEYYLQFADHYFRVLSESRARFEDQRRPQDSEEEFDGEEGDEFEQRDARSNEGRGNDSRGNENRGNDTRNHDNRGNENRNGDNRGNRGERAERPHRRDPEQRERQPEPVTADNGESAPQYGDTPQGETRTRRPRVRRDEQAPQGQALDADRLPPAIAVASTDGEEPVARPRRPRRPRTEVANDTLEVPPAA